MKGKQPRPTRRGPRARRSKQGAVAFLPEPVRRLSALRDLTYTLRDALEDQDYVKDLMGPEVTVEALCAELDARVTRERRLKTPRPLIDRFIQAPRLEMADLAPALARRASELSRAHRRGKAPGHVGWHRLVKEVFEENPAAQDVRIFGRVARRVREGDQSDIEAVVQTDRSLCRADCPAGYHLHCPDSRGRFRTVTRGTFKNHVSDLRRTSK